MKRLPDQRLRLILALSGAAFAVVIGRAVQIQVVEAQSLASKARAQQQGVETISTRRGTILDRHGQPLAQDQPAVDLWAYPAQVRNPLSTAAYIADKLGVKKRKAKLALVRNTLLPQLTNRHVTQARVLRQVDQSVADRILAGHPPGLFGLPTIRRGYPLGQLAAQLIGYTDVEGRGRPDGAGLEYQLDSYLNGHPGRQIAVRGTNGVPLDMIMLQKPRPGRDVRLTIDRVIQSKVQRVLETTAQRWRARSATAIVLDPMSGEILAMATAPGYDNNLVHQLSAKRFARVTPNRAVTDSYEPGSTFKVVTMTAALSAGIVFPSMKFHNLPYQLQVGDRVVHDDVQRGPITLSASQILAQSSNIGTITIAEMVGKDDLYRWIRRFGFGQPTALHFPGEAYPRVLPPAQWYSSSIGNIPIGQGIAVTPMQMAAMYSAIANHGVLVEPHVVQHIGGVDRPAPWHRRIIEPGVDRELVNMLKGVVDTAAGTGVRARIPGYTVAGKTGTAQKPDGHGGYSRINYVASFVGFLPADDPQVEVLVTVDSPRGNIFGGYVAAPAFQEIGTFLTQALHIRPDRPLGGGN
ncbi:MAG: peptidoglycan D,D-transpeptidase FtsI family protein [Gaiellales bacterium]